MALAQRVVNMIPSATIEMNAKSREMKTKGFDVISLSLGEPDFNAPDVVKRSAQKAVEDNYSKYPPIAGFEDVKQAICDKFKNENNLIYQPNEIVISTGAKQSLANVILALINPGDEVLLPAPYWVSYYEQIKLAGGVPIEILTDISTDFKVTAQQLAKYITPKTKLLIYSSPCNPSGSVYSKKELTALSDEILKHENLFVLADEIYEYINFSDTPTASMASINAAIWERTITVNGVAKGFAMTGYRIGYIGAPQYIAAACAKIQGQFTSGANAIAQRATLTALQGGKQLVTYMIDAYKKRRDLVYGELNNIPRLKTNLPEAAFYFFPDVSAFFGTKYKGYTINSAQDLCMYLLEEALVALVPGEAFGAPDCIRISYATSEEILTEAMVRVSKALNQLK